MPQKITKQNRLLRISDLLVTQFLPLGVVSRLCNRELRTSFSQLPKVRVHIKKDLIACVVNRERGLLLRKRLLFNVMAFLTPIPRLPGK